MVFVLTARYRCLRGRDDERSEREAEMASSPQGTSMGNTMPFVVQLALRSIAGFVIQIVPCAALCLMPFAGACAEAGACSPSRSMRACGGT